jgi:predicted ester cyclase
MLSLWNGAAVDAGIVYSDECLQDGESTFGPADVVTDVAALRRGIPDLHFAVEEWFAAGNRYVLRMRATGTHASELATSIGLAPATGATLAIHGIEVFEVDADRIVGVWASWNWGDVFAAIGARLPTEPR